MTSASSLSLVEIQSFVRTHREEIAEGKPVEGIERYYNGHHRRVFSLLGDAHICKLAGDGGKRDEDMLATVDKARRIIGEHGLTHCHVPSVERIRLEERALWIEERLEGTFDCEEAQEASEIEFEKMESDPELKRKWEETFTQAAIFIVETGYWDVDFRNVLLMKDGFGFIDFEGLDLTSSRNKENVAGGLFRLLLMAPPTLIDSILSVIPTELKDDIFKFAHHNIEMNRGGFGELLSERERGTISKAEFYEHAVKILKEMQSEKMALHREVRAFRERNGIRIDSKDLLREARDMKMAEAIPYFGKEGIPVEIRDLEIPVELIESAILEVCIKQLEKDSTCYSRHIRHVRSTHVQPTSLLHYGLEDLLVTKRQREILHPLLGELSLENIRKMIAFLGGEVPSGGEREFLSLILKYKPESTIREAFALLEREMLGDSEREILTSLQQEVLTEIGINSFIVKDIPTEKVKEALDSLQTAGKIARYVYDKNPYQSSCDVYVLHF